MKTAHYAVVRYVADPARNEPVNVGIVLWSGYESRIKFEPDALARVVRQNPHLTGDSLLYLEPFLKSKLAGDKLHNGSFDFDQWDREVNLFPVIVSKPLFTSVGDTSEEALDDEVESLLSRIVRPPKRSGGSHRSPTKDLARRWKPFLTTKRLVQNHVFQESRTGNPRTVNFFANSGANVAVDIVGLAVQRADEIQQRADAEAYKIEDVRARHEVQFIVHCPVNWDEQYREVNEAAIRSIQSAGADVVTDIDEAAQRLETVLSEK